MLSNFSRLRRPELVALALPGAATTPFVMKELERGAASGHLPTCDWEWLRLVELDSAEKEILARVQLVLGDGEASCIAVALERKGALFSDDLDARRYACRHGLPVSGTLGVLSLLAKRRHLTVTEAGDCLRAMIAHGYRSPVTSLADLPAVAL